MNPGDTRVPSFTDSIDLAAERLGGKVVTANDEFFAPKENLLRAAAPIFIPDKYTEFGKWMDGWETRRRREPGYDWCIVRLGLPGVIRGLVVDTSFFKGNYPEECSVEACSLPGEPGPNGVMAGAVAWVTILPRSRLEGDAPNLFPVDSPFRFTHLRLNIFPDGGVARLRVHGEVVPVPPTADAMDRDIDLAAIENGGQVILASDMFFGNRNNLILPGPSLNMGDGWETRRRRGPGHDWAIVRLATEGTLSRAVIDTSHFKGNAPGTFSLEGVRVADPHGPFDPAAQEWTEIQAQTPLKPHTVHEFSLDATNWLTHVRLNIYPDGGVARLRLFGMTTMTGRLRLKLAWLNTLPEPDLVDLLRKCCDSQVWAGRLAGSRPWRDPEHLHEAAKEAHRGLLADEWLTAFRSHPRIGETTPPPASSAVVEGAEPTKGEWSGREQSGMRTASPAARAEMTELNREYEARFGFRYIVCATGKGAADMLADLKGRLGNDTETEMGVAERELMHITAIRLDKLLKEVL
jgi:allantoicase